jgi:hypothetical protein
MKLNFIAPRRRRRDMLRTSLRRHSRLGPAAFLAAALLLLSPWGAARAASELVMFEEQGCGWCRAWHADIGPIYPLTEEGLRAPLRRVDLAAPRPADLKSVKRLHYTPTFVLMRDGEEVGRILGYPGEDFFWGLLDELMKRLPEAEASLAAQ